MTPKLPEEHVTPMKHLGHEFAPFLSFRTSQNLNIRTLMVLEWRPALKSASKVVGTAIPGVRVSKDFSDARRRS